MMYPCRHVNGFLSASREERNSEVFYASFFEPFHRVADVRASLGDASIIAPSLDALDRSLAEKIVLPEASAKPGRRAKVKLKPGPKPTGRTRAALKAEPRIPNGGEMRGRKRRRGGDGQASGGRQSDGAAAAAHADGPDAPAVPQSRTSRR
jgi:hypothetical protein